MLKVAFNDIKEPYPSEDHLFRFLQYFGASRTGTSSTRVIMNTASRVMFKQLQPRAKKPHPISCHAAGKLFLYQFDKSVLTDPEAERKIIEAMEAVRDCFPPSVPAVLSFHLDESQHNPHIHGVFFDRDWNAEKGDWGEINPLLGTTAGIAKLQKMINKSLQERLASPCMDSHIASVCERR